jgi:predicted AlkP superfamily phosphohydrolase/phosphomutase
MSTGIAAVYSCGVRYLRMLGNAAIAAALAASYVLVLLLHLNPRLPLNPLALAPIAESVGAFYVIHFAAVFYIVLVARQLVARELFSPPWVSVTLLAWLGACAAVGAAVLMWANVRTFRLVLPPETIGDMTRSAAAFVVSAALFVLAALGRRYSEVRTRPIWGACLVVIAAGSVAAPAALRGRGTIEPLEARPLDQVVDAAPAGRPARVTMLAIDGASLDLIAHATAEGRLPNFGRILDSGAVLRLATVHPTSAEAVWTAVATGKLPQKNGVRSAAVYRTAAGGESIRLLPDYCYASGLLRFGVLREQPLTAAAIRARPLWSLLTAFGLDVGIVNWPLTFPAPVVRGYVVSDKHLQLRSDWSATDESGTAYPAELAAAIAPLVDRHAAADPAIVTADASMPLADDHLTAGRRDLIYDAIARHLAEARPTQVSIVRYESVDAIGHDFLRYAMPQAFGDVTDEERRLFGSVLERHYGFIDEAIGRALGALAPGDLLMVVSGYGMEPLGFGKRLLEQIIGDPEVSGTHEDAPDGFLMAYGADVANVRPVRRASIVDIVPTVLYFLGLPIARDMDGYAQTDLFLPSFTDEQPLTFIPTYER